MNGKDAPRIGPEAEALPERLGDLLREWPGSCTFSAQSFLSSYPALKRSSSAVVAVAAEEYLRHRLADRTVDVQTFAARFGELETSVLRAAEVMEFFLQESRGNRREDDESWPTVGQKIQHFELLEELGGGLLSRVFVARDEAVARRHVVVKITRNSDREIRALGRLSHPAIVPVWSISTDASSGLTAVVMPFQSRVTLHDVIGLIGGRDGRGGPGWTPGRMRSLIRMRNSLPPCPSAVEIPRRGSAQKCHAEWVAGIGADLADALHAAHEQGVLHCDVKPSNIVLLNEHCAMLVDFNLCLSHDARRIAIGGTIPYMSPEQLCGAAVDQRSDVFSLAATLYHALSGSPPFGSPDQTLSHSLAARVALRAKDSPQCRELAGIDAALAPVVLRALSLEPGDRFPTAASFADALRGCLRPRIRWARIVRRHRKQCAALACSAALLAGGLAQWEWNRPPLHVRATTAGIVAAGRSDFDECVRLSDRALSSRPDFVPALVLRGDALLRRGDLELAYRDLKRAAELTDAADVHALRSYAVYRLTKNDSEGILAMRQALASGVSPAILHNNLGYCLYQKLSLNEALQELKKAVDIDPSLGVAWLNLAAVDCRLAVRTNRRLDTALVEQALSRCPGSCDAHYVAAQVYVQNALTDDAALPLVKSHCEQAMNLGLPRSHVDALLGRLPSSLRDNLAADLPGGGRDSGNSDYQRMERFLIPVDGRQVASRLLNATIDRRTVSASVDGDDETGDAPAVTVN